MSLPWSTAELSDAHEHLQIADPGLRSFGGRGAFHGPVRTLKVFEDNVLVRSAVEQPGGGAVLVVDGGGSLRCALLGDRLAQLACDNGWAGVIVNGCIRDSAVIASIDVGVMALATHPRKSIKRGDGQQGLAVRFLGVDFRPGAYVYADADGLVVSDTELTAGG